MNMQNAITTVSDSIERLHEALLNGREETIEKYLAATAQFHRYSFRNVLLIHEQFPDATVVAGFHAWKKRNRWVKKGEIGIAIFAPMIAGRSASKTESTEDDGQAEDDRKRITTNFRISYVFDISQTEGEPLVDLAPIVGSPGESLDALLDVYRKLEIKVVFTQLPHSVQGYSLGGEVRVQDDLDDAQAFRVLVHELAHEMMHKDIPFSNRDRKVLVETEAEAVACVVSQAFGIDHFERSADYIALHQGDSMQLTKSLMRIHDTAYKVIVMMEQQVGDSRFEQQQSHAA
jgi:hypothetical protein